MTRKNKTRNGTNAQKKSVCLSVIPYVEADILGDGSVFVNLPKRTVISQIINNVKEPSNTTGANISILANGTSVVNNSSATIFGAISLTLTFNARYFETGGELVIKAGSTPPATGSLVGELIIEYIELDKNSGEYTTFLDN